MGADVELGSRQRPRRIPPTGTGRCLQWGAGAAAKRRSPSIDGRRIGSTALDFQRRHGATQRLVERDQPPCRR